MRFSFAYGNHGTSPIHISDMAAYISNALTELGHYVEYNQNLRSECCNIVMEFFHNPVADSIINAIEQGFDVVLIGTEFVTGDTFNNFGQEDGGDWYNERESWKIRHDNFCRVAAAVRSVWSISQDALASYRHIVPVEKLSLIPMGYCEKFATVRQRQDYQKNIDFLFTGSITPRRQAILDQLIRKGKSVISTSHLTPSFIRDDLISRTKVCLNFRQTDSWKYPSTMRYYYHLMNNSFLLSERYEAACPLDKYISFPPTDDFIASALDAVLSGTYSATARNNLDQFRHEMPAAPMFEALLDASFGQNVRI